MGRSRRRKCKQGRKPKPLLRSEKCSPRTGVAKEPSAVLKKTENKKGTVTRTLVALSNCSGGLIGTFKWFTVTR